MKTLTVREVASIKRTAANVYPLVNKKHKLLAKIEELNKDLEVNQQQLDAWEAATKAMTGGYSSEDLLTRVVPENGAAQYKPKENVLVFNEDKKVYEIIEIVEETSETPNVDGEAQVEPVETEDAFPGLN